MADSRFFTANGPFTLEHILAVTGATPGADLVDPQRSFIDVKPLEAAGPEDVAFLENRKYVDAFARTQAGAAFVSADLADRAPAGLIPLICERPRRAFVALAQAFYPTERPAPAIDETARIDPSAEIGKDVTIEPHAVIGPRAEIGDRAWIGPGVMIDAGTVIGADTSIGANAYIGYSIVGERVQIQPGAQIGRPGFGFERDDQGPLKLPHIGRVIIGDDVEIGCNTTVDRGNSGDTTIGAGTMIDNLVMIAHNVTIGKGCTIVSQVGIAGSSKIGDYSILAGQVGVANHVTIGKGVILAAKSGVASDIPDGAVMGGSPAVPIREWRRQIAIQKAQGRGSKGESKR
ncbi:MAG: UDP-3-O-(3-hydroxymyristoyl)glucosamine N-acyltransferase [Alphaproteobacteria bacterium]|nr:UDP-3-O-(3-hydroxymyristoyl)glucosamine N-acyltransferase [Alphaproteobacteria bacterium]